MSGPDQPVHSGHYGHSGHSGHEHVGHSARGAFEEAVLEHLEQLGRNLDASRGEVLELKKMVTGNGDPDKGAMVRIRDVENWQKNASRILWIVVTSVVGLVVAYFFTLIEIVSKLKHAGAP